MADRRRKRDPYRDVGERARHAIETACAADLTPRQHRVLLAVLHLTTTRSRHGDHVWLAQIAAITYGVTEAQDWQLDKTRKELAVLRAAGIIESVAPRGRPKDPSYWVGIPDPSTAQTRAGLDASQHGPNPGRSTPLERPTPGPSVERPDPGSRTARSRPQNGPTPGRANALARPAPGPPTEVLPRFTEEGTEDGDAVPTGNGSAVPSDDDARVGREWWDDPDLDGMSTLTKVLVAIAGDGDDHQTALLISDHLAAHLTPGQREALAGDLITDRPADVRLALRTARAYADAFGLDLPRLDLPTRSTR